MPARPVAPHAAVPVLPLQTVAVAPLHCHRCLLVKLSKSGRHMHIIIETPLSNRACFADAQWLGMARPQHAQLCSAAIIATQTTAVYIAAQLW